MRKTSVLVVDDDIAICQILHRILSDAQYQVQTCHSVADALRAIVHQAIDVYVMDYRLPDGTGLDVAEQIRSKGSKAPIIIISGYDCAGIALRAEMLDLSEIVQKPFSRETICNAVRKGIESSQTKKRPDGQLVSLNSTQRETVYQQGGLSKTARLAEDFGHPIKLD